MAYFSRKELSVLKIAIIFEGLLALIYIFELYFSNNLSLSLPAPKEVIFGIALSQLLFVFNAALYERTIRTKNTIFYDFLNEMVLPIAACLSVPSALIVSIAAGVGEEFFFRGFLQPKIGLCFSSILFGVIHFLFNLKRFFKIAIIYIAIGFIFGFVYDFFSSLWAPVIFHVLYDFSALLYFKRKIMRL